MSLDDMNALRVFFAVRIASVFFVQTFYEADEYWQSLEIAHNFVFGYGYQTWEWKEGIRSYVYPLIFTGLYKFLSMLGIDSGYAIVTLPRIFQALLSCYSDLCFYKWCGQRKWTIFTLTTSWFSFYMGSRTLINTFETSISTIALSMFPWPGIKKTKSLNFIWLVGFICLIRPTASIMWFPLCLYHLLTTRRSLSFIIFTKYLPIGILCAIVTISIDSVMHGSFLLTPYEFFKFNVIKNVASSYGMLPWFWYMSLGLPAVLGVHLMPFILASIVVLKHRTVHQNELIMLGTIVFNVGVLSFLPHKEFRFLTPLLPLIFYITSRYLSVWSLKAKSLHVWVVASVLLVGNALPAYYLGFVHQRGSLDIMEPLRIISGNDPENTRFLFLTPCHSTPLYSHLHVNVTLRFLKCEPNLKQIENYKDEINVFYENPSGWLRENYPPNGTLPTHIITFDSLVPKISDILSRYKTIIDYFHTDVPLTSRFGQRIQIHELLF